MRGGRVAGAGWVGTRSTRCGGLEDGRAARSGRKSYPCRNLLLMPSTLPNTNIGFGYHYALLPSSNATMSSCSAIRANSMAVKSSGSCTTVLNISNPKTLINVRSTLMLKSTSFVNKNLTIAKCPLSQDRCNGVYPCIKFSSHMSTRMLLNIHICVD